jgi:hypothetical protein
MLAKILNAQNLMQMQIDSDVSRVLKFTIIIGAKRLQTTTLQH